MSVTTQHPAFTHLAPDWEQLHDTYRGQRRVKERGTRYLPPTATMVDDANGQPLTGTTTVELGKPKSLGQAAYSAYITRAVFPDLVRPAVEGFLGMMHAQEPLIQLPSKMEMLRDKATVAGESLHALLQQLNMYQLIFGRAGLLVEVQPDSGVPFIALYAAPRIINWDDGSRSQGSQVLELVVLDESENERSTNFAWEFKQKYRVLTLSNQPGIFPEVADTQAFVPGQGVYQVAVVRDGNISVSPESFITPSLAGQTLDSIPFVFVNASDLVPDPAGPPLLGLSDLALTIYRGEADLRQALFLQGQDTLVLIGAGDGDEDVTRVGAGQKISLPLGGDAKYIGTSAGGLSALGETLTKDYDRAAESGSRLLDFTTSGNQSGEALRIRLTAKTATIQNIALTGAAGLQTALRFIARWMGLNETEVIVAPNLDFIDEQFTGREAMDWVRAKRAGAPITLRELRKLFQRAGAADPDKALEEALAEIAAELQPQEPIRGTTDV